MKMRLSKIYTSIGHYLYLHGDKRVTGICSNKQDNANEYTLYLQDVHLGKEDNQSYLGTDLIIISDKESKENDGMTYYVLKDKDLAGVSYDKEETLRRVDEMITAAIIKRKQKLYVSVSTKKMKYRSTINSILWVLLCIFLVVLGRLT